jgi:peptidylprolyl isomerase
MEKVGRLQKSEKRFIQDIFVIFVLYLFTFNNQLNHITTFLYTLENMGVVRKTLKAGHGPTPNRGQKISVHCTGSVLEANGTKRKFWSTRDTNEPFSFNVGLGKVIKGWDEGMLAMQLGEEAELTMTPDYGYGAGGFPAWLVFASSCSCILAHLMIVTSFPSIPSSLLLSSSSNYSLLCSNSSSQMLTLCSSVPSSFICRKIPGNATLVFEVEILKIE